MRVVVQANSAVAPEATRTPAAKLRLAVWEACRRRRLRLAARAVLGAVWGEPAPTAAPVVTPTLAAAQTVPAIRLPQQLRLAARAGPGAGPSLRSALTEPGGKATATSVATTAVGAGAALSSANAIGGAGGGRNGDGAGGDADASSEAKSGGSGNATSSASATGGDGNGLFATGGDANASSAATSNGTGNATSSATSIGGVGGNTFGNLNRVATPARAAVPHLTVRATRPRPRTQQPARVARLWGI